MSAQSTVAIVGEGGRLPVLVRNRLAVALDAADPDEQLPIVGSGADAGDVAHADAIVFVSALTPVVAAHEPDPDASVRLFESVVSMLRRSGARRRLVVVSSAFVYGAYENNPVPLDETAVVRPNEHLEQAGALGEIERLCSVLAEEVPKLSISVLRPAPVAEPAAGHAAAWLLGRQRFQVRGHEPPRQFVHPEDVARAVAHVLVRELDGTFNVVSDGWLSTEEARAITGVRPVARLPVDAARRFARSLSRVGLETMPAGAIEYLRYPMVVSGTRLANTGFDFEYTNGQALRSASARLRRAERRTRRPWVRLAATALVAGGLMVSHRV